MVLILTPNACMRTMAHRRSSEMGLPLGMQGGREQDECNASPSDTIDGSSSARRGARVPGRILPKMQEDMTGY